MLVKSVCIIKNSNKNCLSVICDLVDMRDQWFSFELITTPPTPTFTQQKISYLYETVNGKS